MFCESDDSLHSSRFLSEHAGGMQGAKRCSFLSPMPLHITCALGRETTAMMAKVMIIYQLISNNPNYVLFN